MPSFYSNLREGLGFGPSRATVAESMLAQAKQVSQESMLYVSEGMSQIAQLSMAYEDRGWIRVDGFEREGDAGTLTLKAVKGAAKNGAALVTGNPIMHRAAEAQAGYVHGDGVRITGADKVIKNKKNRRNIFSTTAMLELELTKVATGNVLLFVEDDNTISRIPFHEIQGAVYTPDDKSEIRYFYRVWWEEYTDFQTQKPNRVERKMLYRNMAYDAPREIDLEYYNVFEGVLDPASGEEYEPFWDVRARRIGGVEVNINGVVRHVAPHRMDGTAWGLPDLLAGIFYASEHKELIEAADSIYRAQSQYAVQYRSKTRKALEGVAASLAAPPPIDPATGEPMKYGQTVGFGDDIEMQLMQKIGAGIDFSNFDPIASLASSALGIPLEVVLGQETKDTTIPYTTKRTMMTIRRMWTEVFEDIFEYMGKKGVKIYWPVMDPDPTHRQVQSISGAVASKLIHPHEGRELFIDTFGVDWDPNDLPTAEDWEPFQGAKVAPGSTEVTGNGDGPVTPGQGQTGAVGKLADGDHELRDKGQQDHTRK